MMGTWWLPPAMKHPPRPPCLPFQGADAKSWLPLAPVLVCVWPRPGREDKKRSREGGGLLPALLPDSTVSVFPASVFPASLGSHDLGQYSSDLWHATQSILAVGSGSHRSPIGSCSHPQGVWGLPSVPPKHWFSQAEVAAGVPDALLRARSPLPRFPCGVPCFHNLWGPYTALQG